MGWLRIFGKGKQREGGAVAAGPNTSQFHESDATSTEETASRNAPRRELVQVILRDTMRQHGIPSDWIEVRILSTVSRSGRAGLHVNFVVKQAHERLLHYVFAFQDAFERELARFEPRSRDWMLSLGWEFRDYKDAAGGMPDPRSWQQRAASNGDAAAHFDLIGDAGDRAFAPTTDPMLDEMARSDGDVQRDLDALFAIRDAALADAARKEPPENDFEATRPFEDSGAPKR